MLGVLQALFPGWTLFHYSCQLLVKDEQILSQVHVLSAHISLVSDSYSERVPNLGIEPAKLPTLGWTRYQLQQLGWQILIDIIIWVYRLLNNVLIF